VILLPYHKYDLSFFMPSFLSSLKCCYGLHWVCGGTQWGYYLRLSWHLGCLGAFISRVLYKSGLNTRVECLFWMFSRNNCEFFPKIELRSLVYLEFVTHAMHLMNFVMVEFDLSY
jgi:hypothetical protein